MTKKKLTQDDPNKREYSSICNMIFVLKKALYHDKTLIAFILATSVLAAIQPFIINVTSKFVIDQITKEVDESRLLLIIGIAASTLLITTVSLVFARSRSWWRFTYVRMKILTELMGKSLRMDYQFLEDPKMLDRHQKAKSAGNSDSSGLQGILLSAQNVLTSIIKLVAASAILFTLSPWVILIMLALALLNFLVVDRTKKIDKELVWDVLAPYWRKSYYMESTTSDFEIAKDIRMFSMGKWLMQKLAEIHGFMHDKIVKSKKLWIRAHTTNHFIFLIQQGILYAWLIYGVLYRDVTIGNFTLYLGTVTVFYGTLTDSLNNIADIRNQSREVNDFRTFMEYPEPYADIKTIPIPVADTYEFKFEDVSFRYINADKFALKGLNLTVKAGQRLAVVGLNGAGKTTFIKLLCGLYRPTQGRILLNGIDINNFDRVEYFKLFSPVFQDINLFAFTVAENISLRSALQTVMETNDKTDDDLVYESLQLAGIADKIDSLPKGIKSQVLKVLHEDGVDFSGGERQKLALARALYKNAPIVILDEPTSALDALAEYKLYQDFDKLISNKTAVYISHRLSSTRFCDNIAMFGDGELIEYGTHYDLMQSDGPYSDMFAVQSQYYKDGKEAKVNA